MIRIVGYIFLVYSATCIINLTYNPGLKKALLLSLWVGLFVCAIDIIFTKQDKK